MECAVPLSFRNLLLKDNIYLRVGITREDVDLYTSDNPHGEAQRGDDPVWNVRIGVRSSKIVGWDRGECLRYAVERALNAARTLSIGEDMSASRPLSPESLALEEAFVKFDEVWPPEDNYR